ncbi:MAG: archease [candidate division WOR-3 bacterium]|nr:MAG: archease [candidate division WOR-3 bacterium]
MAAPYRYLDHTADLGIEVFGRTFEELLINIGKAIFETQIKGNVREQTSVTFQLEAESQEDLFIEWCRELLYMFSVKQFIPVRYSIELEHLSLRAELHGDILDPRRHTVRIEIKNPTYHEFQIKKMPELLSATIIFDV